ncbi:MAG: hypothetical protein WKF60_00215 [Ilumatobacter sp.]
MVDPDDQNRLDAPSAAQCQQLRAVSPQRIVITRGNVGPLVLSQIREMLAVIIDVP